MQCAAHPSVETELACGKCEKPICPKCLHYTPVGVRCRECANLKRLPQYELSIAYVARGLGAALVVGAVAGAIWGVIPFGFIGLLVGGGAGYMIGESVSIATNRKVGVQVQVLAGAGVVLAFVVRGAMLISLRNWDIEFVLLRDVFGYLALALAMFVAVGRLR
ncbi:MAG: hypothetical protein J4N98_08660 [Chloroflexi bacterium]|nr:hypothetical protein [Chloroflexota bacterium]